MAVIVYAFENFLICMQIEFPGERFNVAFAVGKYCSGCVITFFLTVKKEISGSLNEWSLWRWGSPNSTKKDTYIFLLVYVPWNIVADLTRRPCKEFKLKNSCMCVFIFSPSIVYKFSDISSGEIRIHLWKSLEIICVVLCILTVTNLPSFFFFCACGVNKLFMS